jgi:hypothetical protein
MTNTNTIKYTTTAQLLESLALTPYVAELVNHYFPNTDRWCQLRDDTKWYAPNGIRVSIINNGFKVHSNLCQLAEVVTKPFGSLVHIGSKYHLLDGVIKGNMTEDEYQVLAAA